MGKRSGESCFAFVFLWAENKNRPLSPAREVCFVVSAEIIRMTRSDFNPDFFSSADQTLADQQLSTRYDSTA